MFKILMLQVLNQIFVKPDCACNVVRIVSDIQWFQVSFHWRKQKKFLQQEKVSTS